MSIIYENLKEGDIIIPNFSARGITKGGEYPVVNVLGIFSSSCILGIFSDYKEKYSYMLADQEDDWSKKVFSNEHILLEEIKNLKAENVALVAKSNKRISELEDYCYVLDKRTKQRTVNYVDRGLSNGGKGNPNPYMRLNFGGQYISLNRPIP